MAIDPNTDRTTYTTTTPNTTGTGYNTSTTHVEERRGGGLGRTLGLLALAALAITLVLWALGFLNFDASGKLEAPTVSVEGGNVPDVQVEGPKVDVGTEKVTVDVPDIDVSKPGDDGSAKK